MSVRSRTAALERKLNIDRNLEKDLELIDKPDATNEEISRAMAAAASLYGLEALLAYDIDET